MSEPQITLHHVPVQRTARYAMLGAPSDQTREVWIACHGYAQLADRFIRRFAPLATPERLIVAPEGLSRFYADSPTGGPGQKVGASWMTRVERLEEIQDYLRFMDIVYDQVTRPLGRRGVQLHGIGFSQGCATIARWAAMGSVQLQKLTLWAGLVPEDLPWERAADRLRGLELVMVAGRTDHFATPERLAQQRAMLDEHEVPFTVIEFDGGHTMDEDLVRQILG